MQNGPITHVLTSQCCLFQVKQAVSTQVVTAVLPQNDDLHLATKEET